MPDAHSPAVSTLRRAVARLAVVLLALVALVASNAVLAPSSDAMSRHTRDHLMHVAAFKKGAPYRTRRGRASGSAASTSGALT